MSNILLKENILDPQMLEYVNALLRFKTKFKLHWSNAEEFNSGKMTMMNSDELTELDSVFVYILDIITNRGLIEKGKYELKRSYANLNFSGQDNASSWHTDTGFEGSDGSTHTILFYPQQWQSEWGGETEFKNTEVVNKTTKVEYKQNQVILFDGKIPHRAAAHNNPNAYRFTIAYKVKLKQ